MRCIRLVEMDNYSGSQYRNTILRRSNPTPAKQGAMIK